MLVSENFKSAAKDYHYLTEKGYPQRGFLIPVGNRYGLSSTERTMLYRGIAPEKLNMNRKKKIISFEEINAETVFIDGFNVLTTISSYLKGKPLFIASDHILRDASQMRGKMKLDKAMAEAIKLLQKYLLSCNNAFEIYLDKKVNFYQSVISTFAQNSHQSFKGEVRFHISETVDNDLFETMLGIVASSDSEIIDQTSCRVFDLARHLLQEKFDPEFPDIRKLI